MSAHEDRSLLSAWLDGELSEAEKTELSRHLESCASCRAEAASLASVKRGLSGASRRALPADLAVSIERRLEASEKRAGGRGSALESLRRIFWREILIPAAVAALVSLIVGVWFVRMRRGPDQFAPPSPALSADASAPNTTALRPRAPVASNDDAQ